LNTVIGPDMTDEKVYDLNPLKLRNFQFIYDPNSGIEDVRLRKLRLTSIGRRGERISLEANPNYNPEAVFDLLDKLQNPSLRLSRYNITQVGFKVFFSPLAGSLKGKTRSFDITYPNSCNLKHDGRDLIIRKMLVASGLEPKTEAAENDIHRIGLEEYQHALPKSSTAT